MLKTLVVALALIFAPAVAVAQSCDIYYQYEFSRDVILQGMGDGTVLKGWVVEDQESLDTFNLEAGSDLVFDGSFDRVLAMVLGSTERGFTLYI